jgi:HSP20 family protein
MLPTRFDPFRGLSKELSTLHREMDDLFRRTFGLTGESLPAETEGFVSPMVNSYVKDNVYHVEAEIPGVDKKDLDVSVEGKMLTLRGERKFSKEVKEVDYLVRESQYGSFIRRLTLPEGVNTEKIHASYENGILEITMPMEKRISGRKILIEGREEKKGGKVH